MFKNLTCLLDPNTDQQSEPPVAFLSQDEVLQILKAESGSSSFHSFFFGDQGTGGKGMTKVYNIEAAIPPPPANTALSPSNLLSLFGMKQLASSGMSVL